MPPRICVCNLFWPPLEKNKSASVGSLLQPINNCLPLSLFFFLDEWYHWGRYNETSFLQKHDFDKDSPSVLTEHQKHKDWINKTNIRATPTILFSGYELPGDKYRLDDLVLLKDVNISWLYLSVVELQGWLQAMK